MSHFALAPLLSSLVSFGYQSLEHLVNTFLLSLYNKHKDDKIVKDLSSYKCMNLLLSVKQNYDKLASIYRNEDHMNGHYNTCSHICELIIEGLLKPHSEQIQLTKELKDVSLSDSISEIDDKLGEDEVDNQQQSKPEEIHKELSKAFDDIQMNHTFDTREENLIRFLIHHFLIIGEPESPCPKIVFEEYTVKLYESVYTINEEFRPHIYPESTFLDVSDECTPDN